MHGYSFPHFDKFDFGKSKFCFTIILIREEMKANRESLYFLYFEISSSILYSLVDKFYMYLTQTQLVHLRLSLNYQNQTMTFHVSEEREEGTGCCDVARSRSCASLLQTRTLHAATVGEVCLPRH